MYWKSLAGLLLISQLFAVQPTTTNYTLQDYGFGNGGGTSGTANYSIEGIAGEQSGQDQGTVNYGLGAGLIEAQQADVPTVALVNSGSWPDKLLVTINPLSNPSDALFAIAISSDNFTTTNYVQNDGTVGGSLGIEDYQTYAAWGGGSGSEIIGLALNTTYKVKVKATQGEFTESGYGPEASAATIDMSVTFDIDVAATDSETGPPFTITFGDLLTGSVNDSPEKIWLDFETNANGGGKIFLYSQYSGLRSNYATYTIPSLSADLSGQNEGFGAQSSSTAQSSGGPLSATSPYNGTTQNVGVTDTAIRELYSAGTSLVGGRSSLLLKAKISSLTPAADDYIETITIIAAANF